MITAFLIGYSIVMTVAFVVAAWMWHEVRAAGRIMALAWRRAQRELSEARGDHS